MTPRFHPCLVNGPFDDPAVYVDFLHESRALMFDLGDIRALSPRKILRISHIFISHAHIDHFIGFNQVLRLCLGREKRLHFFGPPGFIARVEHSLAAFTWNLVESYPTDFTVVASELQQDGTASTVEFHCRSGFRRELERTERTDGGIVLDEDGFRIRTVFLDHKTVSLAFALEEKEHVNIMKNRLLELGLPTGPWLADLKRAIIRGAADDEPFMVRWHDRAGTEERRFDLGALKARILSIVPGQRIAYVTDAAYTQANAAKIVDLARRADYLFIEAVFRDSEQAQASERYHLTARQAGQLARQAGAARVIPFHFSPRYQGMEEALLKELGP